MNSSVVRMRLSAISTLGTVWRDCVAEGLRLIFIPVGVEDDGKRDADPLLPFLT